MASNESDRIRKHLCDALRADLLGPFAADHQESSEEVWEMAPSKRYLTGFLVPTGQEQLQDNDENDDLIEAEMLEAGDDSSEESQNDPQSSRRPLLPSSIGLSVLLPPGNGDSISIRVGYADYLPEFEKSSADDSDKRRERPKARWRRRPREPVEIEVALNADLVGPDGMLIEGTGLGLYGHLNEPEHVDGLPRGARALSLFLVNKRNPSSDTKLRDEAYVFQVELEVRHANGLLARPNRAGLLSDDPDDRVLDLQFRDAHSYASGHGIATVTIEDEGQVVGARTEWLPLASVNRVTTREIEGVEVRMDKLAELGSADAVRAALGGIPEQYGKWLDIEDRRVQMLDSNRRPVGEDVVFKARRARDRIIEGIDLLATDPDARRAFATANRAMAMAARQRNPERYTEGNDPAWRLFQLAFVLLNLPSISKTEHDDRDTVELIFFPTGGGKTEAYLGVIAYTLIWRRMKGVERPDQGLGVAVLLRYTLRLLTLDQLGRAATLICALELLRDQQPELGEVRFSLGLWVGKSATANRLSEVARQISDYKNGATKLSPFPLTACPWCQTEITSKCMSLAPNTKNAMGVDVGCSDYRCDFSSNNGGLPLLFVDEQIYRECPSFIVATVDKFAMLPWRGESGALFGQVQERIGSLFVGPCTPAPSTLKGKSTPLPDGLRPPELVVQDELHLISGPLGTMVGLYETAIEALATHQGENGTLVKPKIIASTATVKRAVQQVRALYGRDDMAMFPPPGIDDSESFFAKVDRDANRRLYLGIAAAGRSMKAVLVTVYGALLAAAQRCMDEGRDRGPDVDPYMTLVGYFNNLRELGGMRRLVEDLVYSRTATRGDLKPYGADENPWMANRTLGNQPVELTSRESTAAISHVKEMLGRGVGDDGFIPVVLASNMISVGVDIDRLGLMVVAGQPMSTSEYIQASSRVGRDDKRPGLVVTCYNMNKPRDRSYYEHFRSYHESFYRHVESASVTPFSGPALERGLAGCLMAMIRHGDSSLVPPGAAMQLGTHSEVAVRAMEALVARAHEQLRADDDGQSIGDAVRAHAQHILDRWTQLIADAKDGGAQRSYSPYDIDRAGLPLLHTALDQLHARQKGRPETDHFVAPTSMRDVEPSVHLWLRPAGWSGGTQ
ncbi:MAG: DISARM system helicase DrmA [Myxococcota bacterium]